jgi:hypothetical protein
MEGRLSIKQEDEPSVEINPYEGLGGRDILKQMTRDNKEGIKRAHKRQDDYAGRVCVATGVRYPDDLFEMSDSDVDEMMVRRLTSRTTSDKM